MLRFLLNNTDTPRTYEIVEYPDDSDDGVLFATITCSELASTRIIKALNATSAAGQSRSEAKAQAARLNGAKGGRPVRKLHSVD